MRVGALERDREGLCQVSPCTWSEDLARREADLQRDGKRASTLAIASFAIGGAALVTGAVRYLTALREVALLDAGELSARANNARLQDGTLWSEKMTMTTSGWAVAARA